MEKILEEIKKARRIVILHHVAPDGDSLGSALALKEMINQFHEPEVVDTVITSYIPELYTFLPDAEELKKVGHPSLYGAYDLAIAVDCAGKDRLGDATELFNSAKRTICIDHHISNPGFADIDLIDTEVSSTGELVFKLSEQMNITLNEKIAINLYTAILTDTGGFKFENTKPSTLRACARLVEAGADPVAIYRNCYEIKPLAMVKLHARVIGDSIMAENGQIAYGVVTRDLLEAAEASDDYIDGITEALRQIKDVEIAIVFKETIKRTTKVSFRSNEIDVCRIAAYFGGGGHRLAAGCLLDDNIDVAIKQVLPVIIKQLSKEEVH